MNSMRQLMNLVNENQTDQEADYDAFYNQMDEDASFSTPFVVSIWRSETGDEDESSRIRFKHFSRLEKAVRYAKRFGENLVRQSPENLIYWKSYSEIPTIDLRDGSAEWADRPIYVHGSFFSDEEGASYNIYISTDAVSREQKQYRILNSDWSGIEQQLTESVLTESVLLEAQNYNNMFQDMMNYRKQTYIKGESDDQGPSLEDLQSYINLTITQAKRTFKRNDRIVWWLRWEKLKSTMKFFPGSKYTDGVFSRLQAKLGYKITDDHLRMLNSTGYLRALIHYLSIPYQPIQNLVWDKQNPISLVDNFLHPLDEEYQKKMSEREQYIHNDELEEDDQMIVKVSNNSGWWLLNRSVCDVEARAMGHCGNTGSYDDRILSYRIKHTTETSWKPHLTFILDEDNYLGETKGRNNDKPAERYHPAIMRLLMHKTKTSSPVTGFLINGIKGGGYLPENNFMMDDLTTQEQDIVKAANPNLKNLRDIGAEFGMDSQELILAVDKQLGHLDLENVDYDTNAKIWVIEYFDQKLDILLEYGDRELINFTKSIVDGEYHLIWNLDWVADSRGKENFIEQLDSPTATMLDNYISAKYSKDSEQYEAAEILEMNDDPLWDAINWSMNTGIEIGMAGKAFEWLQETADNINGPGGYGKLYSIMKHKSIDGKIQEIESFAFGYEMGEILYALEEGRFTSDYDRGWGLIDTDTVDNNIPDFDGAYDAENAMESFRDAITENI